MLKGNLIQKSLRVSECTIESLLMDNTFSVSTLRRFIAMKGISHIRKEGRVHIYSLDDFTSITHPKSREIKIPQKSRILRLECEIEKLKLRVQILEECMNDV